jgi:hypothetical protein
MPRVLLLAWIAASFTYEVGSAQTARFDPAPVFYGGNMRIAISMFGQIGRSNDARTHGWFWPGDATSAPLSRTMCYASTPVLMGLAGGSRRVSGAYYRNSFIPGPISNGKAQSNPTDPLYRAYTITMGQTDAQDYREWPSALGAPSLANGEPELYGRKQMFWVMNDLDSVMMMESTGSIPLGLELRCLMYEPSAAGAEDHTVLLQITYINKGTEYISDAYTGYYMDMDIRDGQRNHAMSDSARGMIYAYSTDDNYRTQGMPAALALVMLQTPIVPAPGERARWFSGWKSDARNMPVTAAVMPVKSSSSPIGDPLNGDDSSKWYALMRGQGASDVFVLNPATSTASRFWISGDPIAGTGWQSWNGLPLSDGKAIVQPVSDKRVLISAGPFDLAPGDTQQVTYAFVAARGATSGAAIHALHDRVDFIRAYFLGSPLATACLEAGCTPVGAATGTGQVDVRARFRDIAPDVRIEVFDTKGKLLIATPLERSASENDWIYHGRVSVPLTNEKGVNSTLVAEWNGEVLRIPARVSMQLVGRMTCMSTLMLEEGDDNKRVAPEEEAKWFPHIYNTTRYTYDVYAQSYHLPNSQWLYIPSIGSYSTVPTWDRPWEPSMGFNSLWNPALITAADTMEYFYDLYDPSRNVWWEAVSRVPTDTVAGEWYDVLMTQVRGSSQGQPGVRIIHQTALQDKWYVAQISGDWYSTKLSLYDSLSGAPYFLDYGLDVFTGPAPTIDGFRVVRGTLPGPEKPGTRAKQGDLFVFNPRHTVLARSNKPPNEWTVSEASPMPLTDGTSVRIELPSATPLRVEVYNSIGQRVKVLRDEFARAGRHLLIWDGYWADGRPADSGMYLLRVVSGNGEVTRKIMVLR